MRLLPAALAVLAVATAAQAAALKVEQPWSRPAVAGGMGAGYLTIVNDGPDPVVLTGAGSPLAQRVEIHAASMSGGVMRMARQEQAVIPPHGKLSFAPGGWHLMLVGLKQPLKAGAAVPLTLAFSGGKSIRVSLAVGDGSGPPQMNHTRP